MAARSIGAEGREWAQDNNHPPRPAKLIDGYRTGNLLYIIYGYYWVDPIVHGGGEL